jgi:hypothetical protein
MKVCQLLLSSTTAAQQSEGAPQGQNAAAKHTWREFNGPAAGLRAAFRGTSPEVFSSRYRTAGELKQPQKPTMVNYV